MLNSVARPFVTKVIDPLVSGLARAGVSPDAITFLGAAVATFGAVYFLGRGSLAVGPWVIAASVIADLLDGALARKTGRAGPWGAFLDSSLDRLVDGAIFASLAYWLLTAEASVDHLPEAPHALGVVALVCLVVGQLVSYVKARAEGLGMTCDVGLVERAERLILVLLACFLEGVGVPYALWVGLVLLAVGSVVTVLQRVAHVRSQSRGRGAAA